MATCPGVGFAHRVPDGSAFKMVLAVAVAVREPRVVAVAEVMVTAELLMLTTPVKSSMRSS